MTKDEEVNRVVGTTYSVGAVMLAIGMGWELGIGWGVAVMGFGLILTGGAIARANHQTRDVAQGS